MQQFLNSSSIYSHSNPRTLSDMHLNQDCKATFSSFPLLPQHFTFTSILFFMLLLITIRMGNKTWDQFLSLLRMSLFTVQNGARKKGRRQLGSVGAEVQAFLNISLEHQSLAFSQGRMYTINISCHCHLSYLQTFNLYKGDYITLSKAHQLVFANDPCNWASQYIVSTQWLVSLPWSKVLSSLL